MPESVPPAPRPAARIAFAVSAASAWAAFLLVATLSYLGSYDEGPAKPHAYGGHGHQMAQAGARLADTLSYFTVWSNATVAIAATFIALQPRKDSMLRRIVHLDALLMIIVTGIVYALLLAPTTTLSGWSLLTNPWQHIVVPVTTVVVWLVFGPRRWVSRRVLAGALVVPLLWIGWMLLRGLWTDTYPYDFANPALIGYGRTMATVGAILGFALVLAALLWLIDIGLRRLQPDPNTSGSELSEWPA